MNISKKSDKKIDWLETSTVELVKLIVKSGAKSSDIDIHDFIQIFSSLVNGDIGDYDSEKIDFIKSDSNVDLINEILNIRSITGNERFAKIEQFEDALVILNKYHDLNNCIVCNSNIDVNSLLNEKECQKEEIINELDVNDKLILEKIINRVPENDVFDIKNTLQMRSLLTTLIQSTV